MAPMRKLMKWIVGAASVVALTGVLEVETTHAGTHIGLERGMALLFAPVCLLQLALVVHGVRRGFGRGHAIGTALAAVWGVVVGAFLAAVAGVRDDWASDVQVERWTYVVAIASGLLAMVASITAAIFPEALVSVETAS